VTTPQVSTGQADVFFSSLCYRMCLIRPLASPPSDCGQPVVKSGTTRYRPGGSVPVNQKSIPEQGRVLAISRYRPKAAWLVKAAGTLIGNMQRAR